MSCYKQQIDAIDYRTDTIEELTGFQRDLLYAIAGREEPHGLALKDDSKRTMTRRFITGDSTPTLTRSSTRGLVEKNQRDRRTNAYVLTQRGQREIDAHRDWEAQYLPEELAA